MITCNSKGYRYTRILVDFHGNICHIDYNFHYIYTMIDRCLVCIIILYIGTHHVYVWTGHIYGK